MKKALTYGIIVILLALTIAFIVAENEMILELYGLILLNNWLLMVSIALLYVLLIRNRLVFFENFFHELTHFLFSILLLKPVQRLYVTSSSGTLGVGTHSRHRNIIIALAPYFMPLLSILLIGLFQLVEVNYHIQIVLASYVVYIIVSIKQLIRSRNELLSCGLKGLLLLFVINFWISLFLISYCESSIQQTFEHLKSSYYEHNGILYQL